METERRVYKMLNVSQTTFYNGLSSQRSDIQNKHLQTVIVSHVMVRLCVCVSVFLHDNSKSNRSRNMKLEYKV